jgi:hypothetical protein
MPNATTYTRKEEKKENNIPAKRDKTSNDGKK